MEKNLMRLRKAINFQPGLATMSLTDTTLHQIASGLQLAAEYGESDDQETWQVLAMFFEATAEAVENQPFFLPQNKEVEISHNGDIMGVSHDEA